MDRHYHKVIISGSPIQFMKQIELLRLSSHIAGRVQVVEVYPEATWHAISTTSLPMKEKKLKAISKTAVRWGSSALHWPGRSLANTQDIDLDPLQTIKSRKQAIRDAARNLVNVKELKIITIQNGLPSDSGPYPCPFVLALLPIVASNLRSLSFKMRFFILAKMLVLSDSFLQLPQLRQLRLEIYPQGTFSNSKPHLPILSFITSLLPTLEDLSIEIHQSNINYYDIPLLPGYIDAFNTCPRLTKLSIVFPLNLHALTGIPGPGVHGPGLPDALCLNQLLRNHRSLRDLTIAGKTCCVGNFCYANVRSVDVMWDWYVNCMKGVSFESLERLVIHFGQHFPVDRRLHLLEHTPSTLKSLAVHNHSLTYVQTSRLLFTSRTSQLEDLSLRVDSLTPKLISLFAVAIPNLRRLVLHVERVEFALGEPDILQGWRSFVSTAFS
ncbi:hypothetical protein C0991_003232 [Blastosporella zonata]|nr:hypothetical protein C0991_003232 [Blastosporella zonata]